MIKVICRRHFSTTFSHPPLSHAFVLLNLPPTASQLQIKQAYYTLAKQYHPDSSSHQKSNDKFKEIQQAYELLRNMRSIEE